MRPEPVPDRFVCESAATQDDWRHDRRLVERFDTHEQAWDRMNEYARVGRSACCFREGPNLKAVEMDQGEIGCPCVDTPEQEDCPHE